MRKVDWTIWFGVAIGTGAVMLGAWFDDLRLNFLWNPTAALIVGGGTIGAIIVRRGMTGTISAARSLWELQLRDDADEAHRLELARLAWLSRTAQKNGVKEYENYAEASSDLLIKQGLTLVADGTADEQIREVLRRRLETEDQIGLQDSATLDAAGGFAPTFGILGAVLGLISVLRVLDKPELLGVGIATAFVATVYGIGAANLFFFPLAARLRARHEALMKRREEIVGVILALNTRETPRTILNQFNLPR